MRRALTTTLGLCLTGALVLAPGTAGGAVGPRRSPSTPPPGAVHVDSLDNYFSPAFVDLGRGGTVSWDFTQETHHSATDGTGLGLFDSGVVAVGAPSTWYTFQAAGIYRVTCVLHEEMVGHIYVPVRAAPASGGPRRRFTVSWAAAAPTGGDVYDVQLRRPGGRWKDWRTGTSGLSHAFVQDAGAGSYGFRARMRDAGSGETADWSLPAEVRVTR